jgi:NADPH-dependent 2,4-dienoyl-CoA reductase/sulfur reductase-like enzyme
MIQKDIIIIGGSAAGVVAAVTAKNTYPEKTVTVFRKEEVVMIPCGIPYIFGSLEGSHQNVIKDQGLLNAGVEIIVNTIEKIDHEGHTVTSVNGEVYQYEKLIIATGSQPIVPSFIKGVDLDSVYTVPKNQNYLDQLRAKLADKKRVAVIGAGFIGVEMSDELAKAGKEVLLIESQEHILGSTFDSAACELAESKLEEHGVNILTNSFVAELQGKGTVEKVLLKDGTSLGVDAVILSIGYRPNIQLAYDSGISCNKQGAIKVDTYMRTHQQDVFACGDCAQKRDFITGKITNIMLASTATAEARVAGMNLYELSTIRTFGGTIGIYSTNIGDTSFGVAGITEARAISEGFSILSASFTGMDRHPGILNGGHSQTIKLVANKTNGLILGAEVIGGNSVGELTNVLGFIIQNKMTVSDVLCSQIGTQPMLTASPAAYPLIKAAEQIIKQLRA